MKEGMVVKIARWCVGLMTITLLGADGSTSLKAQRFINVIEIRDYLLKPGERDEFVRFFNQAIVKQQDSMGGYVLAQFSLRDSADNFVWIRGFSNMQSRSRFHKDFYYSSYWKSIRTKTNSMLLDSYNVNLLKPIRISGTTIDSLSSVSPDVFDFEGGICVADYFIASADRKQLIDVMARLYIPLMTQVAAQPISFWICEPSYNDYLPQHVYQEEKLLVILASYSDYPDYQTKIQWLNNQLPKSDQLELQRNIRIHHSQVLYPHVRE